MHAPVSVIIPCYRCADTIQRAVDSVISQTLSPAEIILVDDFSNDEGATLAAMDRLRESYQRLNIKILRLDKNRGPGTARNSGWKASSQPYLAFLDADDSWHPKKLEIQYRWMAAHPDVILSGHHSVKISPDIVLPKLPEKWVACNVGKNRLLFSNYFPTRSVMLQRKIPDRFIPGKRYAEDYLLWLTIAFNGQPVWFLSIPMAYSYKEEFGDGGLTGNLWKAQQGVFDAYRELLDDGFISYFMFTLVSSFSFLKYLRRLSIVKWRSILSSAG